MNGIRKRALLEPTIANYEIDDVLKPNLLRDIFPYDEIPKIQFDYKIVPVQPAEDIFITDTTFRDGQQARPPYTPEQILALFDLLHKLGGSNGVIRQTEFFLYSEIDREAVEKCLAREYRYPEITGWIRANKNDLELVKSMGLKETGILMSVSDYHIFLKLEKTRKQAVEDYLDVIRAVIEAGITPRCHLEDITRADFDGFVIPFVQQLMRINEEIGKPIKIRACDTMGYGVNYPEVSLPRSVPKIIHSLVHDCGVPSSQLEWHGHNDFHKVLVNAVTAWLYGCSGANGTLLGLGERTGNPPIEGLIIDYISFTGDSKGIDTTVITDIAKYFVEELKYRIPTNYPFVGEEFNATRAGIHADGVMKDPEIYSIFDTEKFLKRPIDVIIAHKSGLASIAYWVNRKLGLEGEDTIEKRHPGIVRINEWVEAQYEKGRITCISSEEMLLQARKFLPDLFESNLDKLKIKAREIATHLVEDAVEMNEIKSKDASQQEPVMQKILNDNPFIQWIYITDLEGKMMTKIIVHPEDRGKYHNISPDDDFSDRPWFVGPLKDGKAHVTDFYISRYTGALCITVSAPIRNNSEDIIGLMGVDIRFEELAKLEEE
ncbi:MAG: cache domain-containing protein [Candidatus Poribacteria bacterium]